MSNDYKDKEVCTIEEFNKKKFSIGDIIQCNDILSPNFEKVGKVVGFHISVPHVFVKYVDGTYGAGFSQYYTNLTKTL